MLARAADASGLGSSFLRFSTAFSTLPLGSPSLAGSSKSTAGTLALTRCAAICAPMTPAPSTAALRTTKGAAVAMASERMGILDRDDVRLVLEAPGQAAGRAAREPGGVVPDAGVLDELVRVSHLEHAGLRDAMLHAERDPLAVLVGQARGPIDVVGGRLVERHAEAELGLVAPTVVGADAVAHRVLPAELQRRERGASRRAARTHHGKLL